MRLIITQTKFSRIFISHAHVQIGSRVVTIVLLASLAAHQTCAKFGLHARAIAVVLPIRGVVRCSFDALGRV